MKKLGIVEILESKIDVVPIIESGIESKLELEIHKKSVPRLRECLVPVKGLVSKGCDLVIIPAVVPEVDKELKSEIEKNILRLEMETGKPTLLYILDMEELNQKNEKKMQEQVMGFVESIVEYAAAFLLEDKTAMMKILGSEGKEEKEEESEDFL